MRFALVAGILVAIAVMTAGSQRAISSAPPAIEPLDGQPDLRIEEPADGATVSTLGFRVVVSLTDFVLDLENYGRDPIPGHGHFHYYLDGVLAGTSWTEAFSIGPSTPGPHTIDIGLRNHDHTFLDPDVSRTFSIVAVESAIRLRASAPSAREGEPLVVSWIVTGFVLDAAAIGLEPEAGRGHVHIDVNGGDYAASGADSIRITDPPAGNHTIRASLHDNDHSPFSQEVTGVVAVDITPGPPRPGASLDPVVAYFAAGAFLVVSAVIARVALRRRHRVGGSGSS